MPPPAPCSGWPTRSSPAAITSPRASPARPAATAPTRESRLWNRGSEAVGPAPEGATWVDVCDRGADIFEYIDYKHTNEATIIVRSKHDRLCTRAATAAPAAASCTGTRARSSRWGAGIVPVPASEGHAGAAGQGADRRRGGRGGAAEAAAGRARHRRRCRSGGGRARGRRARGRRAAGVDPPDRPAGGRPGGGLRDRSTGTGIGRSWRSCIRA